jgi:hypothetical protein
MNYFAPGKRRPRETRGAFLVGKSPLPAVHVYPERHKMRITINEIPDLPGFLKGAFVYNHATNRLRPTTLNAKTSTDFPPLKSVLEF